MIQRLESLDVDAAGTAEVATGLGWVQQVRGFLDSSEGKLTRRAAELHEQGMTIIVVTHDDRIAERCERVIRLADGLIESDTVNRRRSS